MTPNPTYQLRPPTPPSLVAALSHAHGVQPLVAHLMHHAGITPADTLTPTLELAPLPNLQAAAKRLAAAIKERKVILLHGDYDADGITGAAILQNGLEDLGARVKTHIPNRLTDGYGLSMNQVPELAAGTDLLITIDCGITAVEETRAYQELGVEVIITDHHQPKETLPQALIVHPTALGVNDYDPMDLTGAGVAYHLLWAVRLELGHEEPPLDLAPLAAIGTIADVATHTRHNRALIQEGLARIKTTSNHGARTLATELRNNITSTDIGFKVAPRINAAGRLGEADTALELLTTRSEHRAGTLANYLAALNEHRRNLQDAVTQSALAAADPTHPAIVLENPDWHPGVIGIAAAKLVDALGKPTFLSAGGKGSVRVPAGASALAHLQHASTALLAFGGHEAAAGYTLDVTRYEEFKALINEHTRNTPTQPKASLIDLMLHPNDISEALMDELHALEPHGPGNPHPSFALIAPLHSTRIIGKDKTHLQIRFAHDGPASRGVAWGKAELHGNLTPGQPALAIASLNINEWNGQRNIEFTAQHLQPHQPLEATQAQATGPRVTRASDGITVEGHFIQDEPSSLKTGETTVIMWLPEDTLDAIRLLRRVHANSRHVQYALDQHAFEKLERGAQQLLTRDTLRKHMTALARTGQAPNHPASDRCQQVLKELDLLNEHGLLKREQRNPYDSSTLTRELTARYVIHTLVQAYRYGSAAAFEQTANMLLLDAPAATAAEA